MKPISKTAQQTLEILISGLSYGGTSHRKIDNGGAGIMAVSVEIIGPRFVSVAHYYEQNGDLMADPEVVFWHGPDGRFYPVEYKQDNLGSYQRLVVFDDAGQPVKISPRAQANVASFSTTWFRNIKIQQGLRSRRKNPWTAVFG